MTASGNAKEFTMANTEKTAVEIGVDPRCAGSGKIFMNTLSMRKLP